MDNPNFLFDLAPYSRRNRRTLPLRPPRRSAMAPEVWDALVRVKRALDESSRRRKPDRRRGR